MTIFTIVGDPHAKPDNLDKIEKLFNIVEDLGNPVIVLGDLLDTKEIIRGKVLNKIDALLRVSKLKWHIIVGNHDLFNIDDPSQGHALEVFKHHKNVKIVDQPCDVGIKSKLALLPFNKDPTVLRDWLTSLSEKEYPYVMGHFDIATFDYGNGHISDHGLVLGDFKSFKTVISGHYHKYQRNKNITYLGTPFSHTFGESNQTKCLAEFDSEKGTINLIDITDIFPRHITLECDLTDEGTIQSNFELGKDYIRLLVKGTPEQLANFNRVDGIKYVETVVDNPGEVSLIKESDSKEQQFVTWAKDVAKLSDEVIEKGLEVLKHVQ